MHFFYIDESGDTGRDLTNQDQQIMVIGGISLSDEKWNNTHQILSEIISGYFNGTVPQNFELHSKELLSPSGEGPFVGQPMETRCNLAKDILNVLISNSHNVHLIALNKRLIRDTECICEGLVFDPKIPYLLGFDYLVTYINWFIKERLGRTARGLIILDKKEQHHSDIEQIMHNRRFVTTAAHRVKRIVEFGYPIDSRKNPMIQLSDLVIYCTKRFYEIERGLRNNWTQETKDFYAQCYQIIDTRIIRKSIVDRSERNFQNFNDFISSVHVLPTRQWKRKYDLT
jgi:hypothetical protein